jgi:hypothetical protein
MDMIPNVFTSYELTHMEELTGTILTPPQVAVLSNKLATIAVSKLALKFDPLNPALFTQTEAYERGQLDVIQWLLDSSEAAQESLRTGIANTSTSMDDE